MTDKSSQHRDDPDMVRSSSQDSEQSRKGSSTDDFYGAVAQLEESLQDLVGQKKEETLRQATAFIKDASARLNDQISGREDDEPLPRSRRRRRRSRQRMFRLQPGSDHLYRGPNSKIGGVCSGFARYLGVETWAVRLAAVTGLIFVPTLVLPAYIVAYFVMDTTPGHRAKRRRHENQGGLGKAKRFRAKRRFATARRYHSRDSGREPADAQYTDAAASWAPRRMLTHNRADLAQAELRLRRIESFVTSDTYELQKELKKMEQ